MAEPHGDRPVGHPRRSSARRSESERRRLEIILDAMPVGVFIVEGPRSVITYTNQRGRELYAFDNVGLTLAENVAAVKPRDPDGSPRTVESLPAYRALHGEHVRNEEMIVERADGTTYQVLSSAAPLPETDGRSPSAVVVFEDITERKYVEAALQRELVRSRLLLQTSEAVSEWTDLDGVFQALTQAVVGATGHSRATFALWEEADRVVRIVASSGDEPMPRFAATVDAFSMPFQSVAESLKTTVADYDTLPDDQKQMALAVHSHLGLLVPLSSRHRLLGGLFVDDPGTRRDFPDDEIELIEGIADQAAIAIENARLYEAQVNIAATLQQALLELPPDIPGIDFSHLYRSATEAAAIGGDFYDIVRLPDDGYILLIGDVSGHGIEAARAATFVRDAVEAFAGEGKSAEKILADTNDALMRRGTKGFVSVLVAILSTDRRRLSYCSAGHPNPILRRDGVPTMIGTRNALPLGVYGKWSCRLGEIEVMPRDLLVFYTDGLTEARTREDWFGETRLLDAVGRTSGVPLAELPAALLDEALAFTGGALQDDVAILAVQVV